MTDFRQLRHFVTLAETLNYRLAAERLGMAQPPLSASIRKLEDALGHPLFARSRRGTSLTPAGAAALEDARRALMYARKFESVVRDVALGLAGLLQIGYVASAAYDLLPRIIPRFREAYPNVDLQLVEGTSVEIIRQVEQRILSLGLVRTPLLDPTRACVQTIHRDPLVAALPDVPRWTKAELLHLSDLASEPFVFFAGASARGVTMAACHDAGFTPQVSQEATVLHTVVSLVRSGLGVALVPEVARQRPVPGVVFRRLEDVDRRFDMGMAVAWLDEEEAGVGRRFRKLLQEAFATDWDDPVPATALEGTTCS